MFNISKSKVNIPIEDRLGNMEAELVHIKRCNRWLLGVVMFMVGGLIIVALTWATTSTVQAQAGATGKTISNTLAE
ncbi:MAG: hypothetical protein ABIF71_07845 [Planctomycetota bacterium]